MVDEWNLSGGVLFVRSSVRQSAAGWLGLTKVKGYVRFFE